jgi:hypothetical protein
MSTEIELINYVDADKAREDVDIDMTDLTGCMARHPGLFSFYSTQAVRAKSQADRMKSRMELVEAALDRKHRQALKGADAKVTEPQIKSAVQTDPIYRETYKLQLDAVEMARFADAITESFHQRKDMLLQIARDAAREQTGGSAVMRVHATEQNKDRFLSAASAAVAS